jgi:GPH family glycoside/pentoside/hexuronide:cation symporter
MSIKTNQLPRYQKLAWGMGGMTNDLVNVISVLAIPIYSIALGVNPALIGIALMIPRVWDAFSDPIMGHISDNFRSRWGRRRPLILIGAVLLCISFPLLWTPNPEWGSNGLAAYLLVMLLVYYTAYTIWSVPWNALGFEMTPDYNERTRVQAWRAAFATSAGLFISWTYKLCFLFNENEVIGARYVGALVGLVLLVTGSASAFFCRERIESQAQKKIKLIPAFTATLKNRPFLLVCGTVAFFILGVFLVQPMAIYVNIYYVFQGSENAREAASVVTGLGGMLGAVLGLAFIPAISWLATNRGKKQTLLLGMAITAVSFLSQYWTFLPAHPYLQLISFLLKAPSIAFIWLILPSMVADICDVDELDTGLRREGMYGAVYGWVLKIGVSLGLLLSGFVLTMAGIDPAAKIQSPEAIRTLRILFSLIPFLFTLGGAWLIYRYPLTEARVNELKEKIDALKKRKESNASEV